MAYDVKIEIRLLINRIGKIEIAGGGTRNILGLHGREGGEGPMVRKLDVSRKENSIPIPADILDLSKIPYARCFNNEAKDLTPRVSPSRRIH